MNNSNFEAADSSLGFYFQSVYSLVLLSRASDDGIISIETIDDLKLTDGGAPVLGQLKHSTGTPPALNEKNDGLWKTIRNWISIAEWDKYRFMFVTCAEMAENCDLVCLSQTNADRDVSLALNCLRKEARRVVETPTKSQAKGEKGVTGHDYKIRRPACQSFLDLGDKKQKLLLHKLTLVSSSFNAGDIEIELRNNFLLAEPQRNRAIVAERLIEWWDRRIAKALLGKSRREVQKSELLERLSAIRVELTSPKLPDDFGRKEPDDISSEFGGNMERQIELVDGGFSRVKRAARERWRARSQRERWMGESLAFADELDEYDKILIEEWKDRHDAMTYDANDSDEEVRKKLGLQLLDWSHLNAHLELSPFKEGVDLPFIVRGSFQQLAEELLVGWHPDYMELCSESLLEMRWHDGDEH